MRFFFLVGYFFFSFLQVHANHQWSPPINLSLLGKNASSPQIAIDSFGNATAVWFRFDGEHLVVQSSTKKLGKQWQTLPDTLSPPNQESFNPYIIFDYLGNEIVIWEAVLEEHTVIQVITRPVGGSWPSKPETISLLNQQATSPKIVVDSYGNLTAVWQCKDDHQSLINASTKPFGKNWQTYPTRLSLLNENSTNPQITIDSQENITLVWQSFNGEHSHIQSLQRMFLEDWPEAPETISYQLEDSSEPKIAVNPFGDVTAVWSQFNGVNSSIHASTKLFGSDWQAKTDCLSEKRCNAISPQIAIDSEGNTTVVWESVFNNKRTSVHASTKPHEQCWQAIPTLLSSSGTRNFEPHLIIDSSGNTIALWNSYEKGFTYVHTLIRPFAENWQTAPTTLSWPQRVAFMSQISTSPLGEAIALWILQESTSFVQASTLTNYQ